MAWTEPTTWQAGDPLTADRLNTEIKDNLIYLNTPAKDIIDTTGNDITTSSQTWVDVDSTYFSSTITTTGKDVWVNCLISVRASYQPSYIDFTITVDGTRLHDSASLARVFYDHANRQRIVTLSYIVPDLAAGTHTFALQWKFSAGSPHTATIEGQNQGDIGGQWFVREI